MDNVITILPKIWLERIQGFGKLKVPDNYPKSSSKFSTIFDDNNDKLAVTQMESELGTENSIITSEMIPENRLLGNYFGTFNVTAEAGVETLLSPIKFADQDADALAFQFVSGEDNNTRSLAVEESEQELPVGTWTQIENLTVKDGYVYGTLESETPSPVAVFTIRRDTYLDTSGEAYAGNVFVANGIPVVISTIDGQLVATDANGKVTELPENTCIIGGTIDGTSIHSTSITVIDSTISNIRGGSVSENNIVTVDKVSINISGSTIQSGITGSMFNSQTEEFVLNISDSTFNKGGFIGAGEAYWNTKNKDANSSYRNKLNELSTNAPCWVKKVRMNLQNVSGIELLYVSGNTGYYYVEDAKATLNNVTADYLLACGSNGKSSNVFVSATDCAFKYAQTTNRGYITNAEIDLKNSTVEKLFIAGDSTDNTVKGYVDQSTIDVTGGSIVLYAGTNGGVQLEKDTVEDIVHALKISRSTELTFGEENGKDMLGNLIRYK